MMERLFTLHAQETAFLALMLGGVALGALLRLLALLRRRCHALAVPADVLAALALLAMLLLTVVRLDAALRLHSLLGLMLGLALFEAGIFPLVRRLGRALGKSKKEAKEKQENALGERN